MKAADGPVTGGGGRPQGLREGTGRRLCDRR